MQASTNPQQFKIQALRWAGGLAAAVVLMAVGGGICYGVLHWTADPAPTTRQPGASDKAKTAGEGAIVKMPEDRWEAAGIRIEPAKNAPFSERVWRSGRLDLNESRVAHISPPVEGVVREVKVRLGQDVRAGDVLGVLDSREVGQAKLDLAKTRLASTYAKAQHGWTQGTSRTATEMVKAMAGNASVAEIEKQFKDRPIGDLRQQLMTAYSRRLQAKAHHDGVSQSDTEGSLPKSTVVRLRAEYEAAEAAYRALCEEVNFQASQQTRASEQKLREAQTAEAMSKANLMMLGFSQQEVEEMDPITEGGRVSLYPIRAPFGGTVLEQHAVVAERVGPQHQLFQLADLSILWLKAEVPQKDLPLVQGLTGGKVKFRATEGAGTYLDAEVFYTGDVVDKETRTVALTASVPNAGRRLKPGGFVEVELGPPGAPAVQVPTSAIQRQGPHTFVFVHTAPGEFRRVGVKVGRTSNGVAEILEGLKPGQPVAVSGGFILKSEMFKD